MYMENGTISVSSQMSVGYRSVPGNVYQTGGTVNANSLLVGSYIYENALYDLSGGNCTVGGLVIGFGNYDLGGWNEATAVMNVSGNANLTVSAGMLLGVDNMSPVYGPSAPAGYLNIYGRTINVAGPLAGHFNSYGTFTGRRPTSTSERTKPVARIILRIIPSTLPFIWRKTAPRRSTSREMQASKTPSTFRWEGISRP